MNIYARKNSISLLIYFENLSENSVNLGKENQVTDRLELLHFACIELSAIS